MQAVEYNLALGNQITINDIASLKIPNERKFVDLLSDRYLMIYKLSSQSTEQTKTFKDFLMSLKKIDPKNVKVNTNIEHLKYPYWTRLKYKNARKYYDSLVQNKYVDKTIKARMILNYVAYSGWNESPLFKRNKRTYFSKVKRYIKPAKLNVSETFELASYYAYFKDYRFVYNLVKQKVYQSTSPEEIVFFLKLIYYMDESVSSKTVIKHFKRIAALKGKNFVLI